MQLISYFGMDLFSRRLMIIGFTVIQDRDFFSLVFCLISLHRQISWKVGTTISFSDTLFLSGITMPMS